LILVAQTVLAEELGRRRAAGLSVGVLSFGPNLSTSGAVEILPNDPDGYAAELYAALHRLDDAGCNEILVAEPPMTPAWLAVRDRLARAASSE
jgi:L-threonylcarbamoyladenylate synthase